MRQIGLGLPLKYHSVLKTGLFEREWYEQQYGLKFPSVQAAVRDFVDNGLAEGRNPNPFFDTVWYLKHNPDVTGNGNSFNPVVHYATHGWQEGRNPSRKFDVGQYLIENVDVVAAGTEPLKHFLSHGRREGRKPRVAESPRSATLNTIRTRLRQSGIVRDLRLKKSARLVKMELFQAYAGCRFEDLAPASRAFDPRQLNIHWVIPDFKAGAGGHMTIFRIVKLLESLGHKNTIWINSPSMHNAPDQAYETIVKHFQNVVAEVHFVARGFENAEGDIVMATDFWTAWPVLNARKFKRRFYFVQDYEPFFHPMGAEYRIAQQTYEQDFDCICAGPWLEGLMRDRHGLWARSFWLAVDHTVYFPSNPPPKSDKVVRIAFYSRHRTARRAVTLGFMALEQLAGRDVSFHVHFFGADTVGFDEAPFPATDHGVLSARGLAELYRKCDIGVVFSATNYSLVPQEMMACGIPVVELDGESTRAVFPDGVVTLVDPHPRRIADALETLINDPGLRRRQSEAASRWIEEFTWPNAARTVGREMVGRLVECGFEEKLSTPAIVDQRPTASIVIPTLNGGDQFAPVLERARGQQTPWRNEILVIDSGSTDGTVERVKSCPDVRLIEIDPSEFGHGRTRNLGVENTEGAFVAFLTHDALPSDEYWLYNIVALLRRFPDAAGAFGRHVAYPHASAFTRRDLERHFGQFDTLPICLDGRSDFYRDKVGETAWRQRFHFYSDNNSCMRRSVWRKLPYPDVDYGEDQLWADQILRAGYGKVYARNAVVYHSHDYDADETFERSRIEAVFFLKHFGYELMTSSEGLAKTLKGLNSGDENWAREFNIPVAELAERKRLNQARLEGYLAAYQEVR